MASEEKLDNKIELKQAEEPIQAKDPVLESPTENRLGSPDSLGAQASSLLITQANNLSSVSKADRFGYGPVSESAPINPKKVRPPKQPPSLPFGNISFFFILLFLTIWFGQPINAGRLSVLTSITELTNKNQIVEIKVSYTEAICKWKGQEEALPLAKGLVKQCTKIYGANDARTAYAKLFLAKLLLDSRRESLGTFGFVIPGNRENEAKQMWTEALIPLASSPDLAPQATTETLCKLAGVYFERGETASYSDETRNGPAIKEDFSFAAQLYKAALLRWDKSPGCDSQTNVWANLAECLVNQQDYKGAFTYMKMALEKTIPNGNTQYNVYRYEKICKYLRLMGELDESKRYGELGVEMAKKALSPSDYFYGAAQRELRDTETAIAAKLDKSMQATKVEQARGKKAAK